MKIILYICIRKNKETYLIKNLKNMDIILKTQTKEIEKGTLVIEKVLEKDAKVPYYVGYFIPKNYNFSYTIIKRFSYFSMSYLESKI
jgi:hypothetical protein